MVARRPCLRLSPLMSATMPGHAGHTVPQTASIKAHSTRPLPSRPYGQCGLLPLFMSSVDASRGDRKGRSLDKSGTYYIRWGKPIRV